MAETRDGWCYDLSKVVPGKVYAVAYIIADIEGACKADLDKAFKGVYKQALLGDNSETWFYKAFEDAWEVLHWWVYAFRDLDPLLEPPPFPSGCEESNV